MNVVRAYVNVGVGVKYGGRIEVIESRVLAGKLVFYLLRYRLTLSVFAALIAVSVLYPEIIYGGLRIFHNYHF